MKTAVETKKKKAPKTKANGQPLVVSVKTERGNVVSMRQITPSEAKALRNSAYKYLA